MTRRSKVSKPSGYTIMLVDDNPDYLQATRLLLERDGHEVLTATNGREALELLKHQPVDLLLLDYFMPGMTGEQVVAEIRKSDPHVQVILQTGYASEQPPQELLRRLDIQGYYDKTEGPDQLLMWTAVGLKAAATIQLLNRSRDALRELLRAAPELHRIQPMTDLLAAVLRRAMRLVAAVERGGTIPAPSEDRDGFVALVDARKELVVASGVGRFSSPHELNDLDPELVDALRYALTHPDPVLVRGGTVVPLATGATAAGALFLGCVEPTEQARELLHVFASQACVAIQNAKLFELVNVDPQTGLHTRPFFDDWLLRAINDAVRHGDSVGIVLCSFEAADPVSERDASLASDIATASLGAALGRLSRAGDIVARFGSDEFGIIVPRATEPMLHGVARRWVDMVASMPMRVGAASTQLAGSAGLGMLGPHPLASDSWADRSLPSETLIDAREALIRCVLDALALARQGQDGVRAAGEVAWPP